MIAELGIRRGHAGLLLLLALTLFSSRFSLRDPWPADEPRYALVAKQMVDSGDWLFPHRGNELYPDKPPLFDVGHGGVLALVGGVLALAWGDKLPEGYGVEPWWLFAAVGALGILFSVVARRQWAFLGLVAYLWAMWLCYGWWAYPLFNPVRSTEPFLAQVGERIGPSAHLGLVDWKEQFLLFADRPAKTFGFVRPVPAQVKDAIDWLRVDDSRGVLLSSEALALFSRPIAQLISASRIENAGCSWINSPSPEGVRVNTC